LIIDDNFKGVPFYTVTAVPLIIPSERRHTRRHHKETERVGEGASGTFVGSGQNQQRKSRLSRNVSV